MAKKREGMECPSCASKFSDVLWTRPWTITMYGREYTRIRRRRKCNHCGTVWNTVEVIEELDEPGLPQDPPEPQPPKPDNGEPPNPFLPS